MLVWTVNNRTFYQNIRFILLNIFTKQSLIMMTSLHEKNILAQKTLNEVKRHNQTVSFGSQCNTVA